MRKIFEALGFYKVEYKPEQAYVNNKEEYNYHRIQNAVATNEVIEDNVGCAVMIHQEHIVIIKRDICAERRHTEAAENT